MTINVLIACEESQTECKAFRAHGFNAFSCDIQPCYGGHPEWHIWSDVSTLLEGRTTFQTMDGKFHRLSRWHLIIAHPPCTYLCRLSSVQYAIDPSRHDKMIEGRRFFFKCLNAKADFVAVENPIPMARAQLPRPTTYVEPFHFGSKWSKKTLLWLRNLPPLMPTCANVPAKSFVSSRRGKYRSRSFQEIAEAMAIQWGEIIRTDLQVHRWKKAVR